MILTVLFTIVSTIIIFVHAGRWTKVRRRDLELERLSNNIAVFTWESLHVQLEKTHPTCSFDCHVLFVIGFDWSE